MRARVNPFGGSNRSSEVCHSDVDCKQRCNGGPLRCQTEHNAVVSHACRVLVVRLAGRFDFPFGARRVCHRISSLAREDMSGADQGSGIGAAADTTFRIYPAFAFHPDQTISRPIENCRYGRIFRLDPAEAVDANKLTALGIGDLQLLRTPIWHFIETIGDPNVGFGER